MPYLSVRTKYSWDVYGPPWPLWSCSCTAALFFSFFLARRTVSNTRFIIWFAAFTLMWRLLILSGASLGP